MKKTSLSGSHEWRTATSRHLHSNFKVESLERKPSKNGSEFFSALSPIKEKKKMHMEENTSQGREKARRVE